MTDDTKSALQAARAAAAKAEREARLAKALRDNLRRRKAPPAQPRSGEET